jgi:hypothetical protein
MEMMKATNRIAVVLIAVVLVFSATGVTDAPDAFASSKTKVTKPSKVKAKGGAGKITVSWKKRGKASGYIVYMARETKAGKPGRFKKTKTVNSRRTVRFTKKNLSVGKRYYFKVRTYIRKNGRIYKSRFSKTVSAKVKGGYIGGRDPKKPDFRYKTLLPPLRIDKNGAYHIDGNSTDVKGAYAHYVENYPTLDNKAGLVPLHILKVKDKKCTVYYTLDGTTPNPANGKKVTKSTGTVKVYHDKQKHTYKVRGYVNGKEVFHQYFTDGYLYYYDRLPPEDPGPLVDGVYQGFKYDGLVDGLIWWE